VAASANFFIVHFSIFKRANDPETIKPVGVASKRTQATADELSQIALAGGAGCASPSKQTPLLGDDAIRVSREMLKGNPPKGADHSGAFGIRTIDSACLPVTTLQRVMRRIPTYTRCRHGIFWRTLSKGAPRGEVFVV
jgi:hypothetical protein